MDEETYERKLRRRICFIIIAEAVLINICYLYESGFAYLNIDELVTINMVMSLIIIFELALKVIFRIAETIKAAFSFIMMLMSVLMAFFDKTVIEELLEERFLILILFMNVIPFIIYNIFYIRYRKRYLIMTEFDEGKLILSRKFCILLALQQTGIMITLLMPAENILMDIHFHKGDYALFFAFAGAIFIISTVMLILEWKYNELFEFAETGKCAAASLSTPLVIILCFGLLRDENKNWVLTVHFAWITGFLTYFLYRRFRNKLEKKIIAEEYAERELEHKMKNNIRNEQLYETNNKSINQ